MSEKRKNVSGKRPNPDVFPCPVCGAEAFNWGKTIGHTSAGFRFMPDTDEMFPRGKWIRARECKRCGNVQLFTRNR